MEIKDLNINQTIEINGREYRYKGVNKIRRPNFGLVSMIVFEPVNKELATVAFNVKLLSRELKVYEDGKIEFK